MQVLQELTWGSSNMNHTYLLDKDRILAYIPAGSTQAVYFSGSRSFDRRGRQFKELKQNPFKIAAPERKILKIQGSRGAVYEVDFETKSCSCPGFVFRGRCKHIENL